MTFGNIFPYLDSETMFFVDIQRTYVTRVICGKQHNYFWYTTVQDLNQNILKLYKIYNFKLPEFV